MKTKFYLALAAIPVQIILWLIMTLDPLRDSPWNESFHKTFQILQPVCILAPVPFFMAILQNKSARSLLKQRHCLNNTSMTLVRHVMRRIAVLGGIIILGTLLTRASNYSAGGYAALIPAVSSVLALLIFVVIDTAIIFFKEKDSRKFYLNLLILVAIAVLIMIIRKDW